MEERIKGRKGRRGGRKGGGGRGYRIDGGRKARGTSPVPCAISE